MCIDHTGYTAHHELALTVRGTEMQGPTGSTCERLPRTRTSPYESSRAALVHSLQPSPSRHLPKRDQIVLVNLTGTTSTVCGQNNSSRCRTHQNLRFGACPYSPLSASTHVLKRHPARQRRLGHKAVIALHRHVEKERVGGRGIREVLRLARLICKPTELRREEGAKEKMRFTLQ